MLLSERTSGVRRVSLVGLAKNTGKTVALRALLRELAERGRRVGVTSVGRDGEEHDAIDFRIEKPRVRLQAGSIVATTDALLRASGLAHELLADTGVRTPLGSVLLASLLEDGEIEVAGPSAAADVRAAADEMLAHGAEQVLIDGAIDRRAASSPEVSDGLVISTGAVLSEHLDEVVRRTVEAVELVRLPPPSLSARELLARMRAPDIAADGGGGVLAGDDEEPLVLPPRFALTADAPACHALLAERPRATVLLLVGALPEALVNGLALAARRGRRELAVVAADPTKVFLSERGAGHYRAQGVSLHVLAPIDLRAVTLNPLAPLSHELDSARLRARLSQLLPDVPVLDVLSAEYLGTQGAHHVPGRAPG